MLPEKTENRPVYVIGHQNPDTDAICSAIGECGVFKNSWRTWRGCRQMWGNDAENILGIGKGRSAGADTDS